MNKHSQVWSKLCKCSSVHMTYRECGRVGAHNYKSNYILNKTDTSHIRLSFAIASSQRYPLVVPHRAVAYSTKSMLTKIIYQPIILKFCLARWRSGRASGTKSRGPGFDPHRRHRVVSFRKTHYLPRALGKTQEALASSRQIVDRGVKPQIKQTNNRFFPV